MRRQLYCFECCDQLEHSVLQKKMYEDKDGETRIIASSVCANCKTENVIDMSKGDWAALLKNERWEV